MAAAVLSIGIERWHNRITILISLLFICLILVQAHTPPHTNRKTNRTESRAIMRVSQPQDSKATRKNELQAISTAIHSQQSHQSADTPSIVGQGQPLQARSSNSGTSVKRSENFSVSSFPAGDACSEKTVHQGVPKASATNTFSLVPGQLTTAFQALKPQNSTAMPQEGSWAPRK